MEMKYILSGPDDEFEDMLIVSENKARLMREYLVEPGGCGEGTVEEVFEFQTHFDYGLDNVKLGKLMYKKLMKAGKLHKTS